MANERFVTRVYQDFLLRDPEPAELSAAVGGLDNGSLTRNSFLSSLFNGYEFRSVWIVGVWGAYVNAIPLGQDFDVAIWNLSATSDFLGTELDVLASSRFFSQEGGTNTGYVRGLYRVLLNREADTSGLNYWVSSLNGGTTRRTVASNFARGPEASGKRVGLASASSCSWTILENFEATRAGSYCLVLDRVADSSGASYWKGVLQGGGQLPTLWRSLAASSEYYNLAQST